VMPVPSDTKKTVRLGMLVIDFNGRGQHGP
jgi:hypothetical protein